MESGLAGSESLLLPRYTEHEETDRKASDAFLTRRLSVLYDVTGTQTTTQHNGTTGEAPEISNIRNLQAGFGVGSEYFEHAPKDMVTSLPGDPESAPPTGQMVRIRAHFNKSGRYVWHCHILSHEDHEMMRFLQVG